MNWYFRFVLSRSFILVPVISTTYTYADQTLPVLAEQVQTAVKEQLVDCGLTLVNMNAAVVPQAHGGIIDATYAVQSRQGQVLGYFLQSFDGPAYYRWVSPQLGYEHSIQFTTNFIALTRPDAGTVAQATRSNNPFAFNFHLDCGLAGRATNFKDFEYCIYQNFVLVVAARFCR